MRSIIYNGIDLSDVCSAQVVGRSLNSLAVESMRVAGMPGALPVDSWVPPEDVRVRLMMDPGFKPDTNGMADMRHRLRSWLLRPDLGELVLPDEPEMVYHDAFHVEGGTRLLKEQIVGVVVDKGVERHFPIVVSIGFFAFG